MIIILEIKIIRGIYNQSYKLTHINENEETVNFNFKLFNNDNYLLTEK